RAEFIEVGRWGIRRTSRAPCIIWKRDDHRVIRGLRASDVTRYDKRWVVLAEVSRKDKPETDVGTVSVGHKLNRCMRVGSHWTVIKPGRDIRKLNTIGASRPGSI